MISSWCSWFIKWQATCRIGQRARVFHVTIATTLKELAVTPGRHC